MKTCILSVIAAAALALFAATAPALADDKADEAMASAVYKLPSAMPPRAVAVVYSGDGGWQDLDKVIGEWLSTQAVNVVGVSTLKAFWEAREPPVVAQDLERLVAEADPSGKLPILIVGYSFGADVFPFAWPELSPAVRDRIKLVALLAVEPETEFHVSIEGWLGVEGGTYSVTGAMAKLPADRVLCMYGASEADTTACKPQVLPGMTIVTTTGDHHFDGDFVGLGKRILAAFDNRVAGQGDAVTDQGTAPAAVQ